MTFDYADKLIKDLNRRNLRMFDNLKLLPFDELNVLRTVKSVYKRSAELAKKRYLMIALDAYIEGYMLAMHCSRKVAEKKASESITEDFILEMLDDYDPVTLYKFELEMERKAERLAEALLASEMESSEVDKALKYWTLQETHYADKSVVEGALKSYKDAGVKKVRWITQKDSKVCADCRKNDGKVFPVGNVPWPEHYRCRCLLVPIN